MKFKYAEWRKVEPRLDEGVDELIIHTEAMTGISEESMFIFREVKEIKIRYRQQKDELQAKIDTLKKEKEKVTIQVIVNGAPLSAAIIPSKTSNPFFLIVEM